MRHESNRIRTLAIVLAAMAFGTSPQAASAEAGGEKTRSAPKAEAAAKKPAAALPQGSELAKAADGLAASCPKALALRERIETLAAQRKTSLAAISTAQNESKKELRNVTAAQKQAERAMKKPGGDSASLLERARTAHEAAVAHNAKIASELQTLRAAEDELGSLATAAEEAATACAAAEATLRNAAADARKFAADARRESARARSVARMPPAKAQEAARAKRASDLEALNKSTDEANGALAALEAVAASPGQSGTAPGHTGTAPGQAKKAAGPAHDKKPAAPGQQKKAAPLVK